MQQPGLVCITQGFSKWWKATRMYQELSFFFKVFGPNTNIRVTGWPNTNVNVDDLCTPDKLTGALVLCLYKQHHECMYSVDAGQTPYMPKIFSHVRARGSNESHSIHHHHHHHLKENYSHQSHKTQNKPSCTFSENKQSNSVCPTNPPRSNTTTSLKDFKNFFYSTDQKPNANFRNSLPYAGSKFSKTEMIHL